MISTTRAVQFLALATLASGFAPSNNNHGGARLQKSIHQSVKNLPGFQQQQQTTLSLAAIDTKFTEPVTGEATGNGIAALKPEPVVEAKKEVKVVDENKRNSVLFCHTLALNSGILNGIFLSGIMGAHQAVGPVTDSWTKSALGFSVGDITKGVFILKILASFSAGAFVQGLLNPNMSLFGFDHKTRSRPFLVMSGMMATATYLVMNAANTMYRPVAPAAAFFLVCATNGMQNSFSSFLTANLCRTSHFTGTTTDLMTILAQCVRGNKAMAYKIPVYGALPLLFMAGGFLGMKWTSNMATAGYFMGASAAWYAIAALPWAKMINAFKSVDKTKDALSSA